MVSSQRWPRRDLGANFYLTEQDVGCRSRAEAVTPLNCAVDGMSVLFRRVVSFDEHGTVMQAEKQLLVVVQTLLP